MATKRNSRTEFLLRQSKMLIVIPCGIFYFMFELFIRPRLEIMLRDKTKDYTNVWREGEKFDAKVYLSIYPELRLFEPKSYKLIHQEHNFTYYTQKIRGEKLFSFNHTIPFSDKMKTNETIPYYIAVFSLSRCNFMENFDPKNYCANVKIVYPIIRWNFETMVVKKNLIGRTQHITPVDENQIDVGMPYYFNEADFDLVYDTQKKNIEETTYTHNYKYYLYVQQYRLFIPPASYDEFLEIRQRRKPLNLTADRPDINTSLNFYIRGFWLWDLKLSYEYDARNNNLVKRTYEDFKSALYDTPPFFLYAFIAFLLVNILFNVLSFIEDFSWWTTRDTFEGISLRALVFTAIAQFFILLYIVDEKASDIVIVKHALGWAFTVWKVTKLFDLSDKFPYFKIKDDYLKKTQMIDMDGGRYFIYTMIPLLVGWSIYQLIFSEFKSFYSFFLQSIVSGIYAFGFLAMFPQVYVNYKLKSVAGMSVTALIYKFISTFIDDLYAIVLKMPLLHKIACFRDDIIFVIWIYQCFIYKVDPTRQNEFGEILAEKQEIDQMKEKKDHKKREKTPKSETKNAGDGGITHRVVKHDEN